MKNMYDMTVFPLFLDSIQTQERPGMLIPFKAFEPPLSREVQQMHHFKQKLWIQTKDLPVLSAMSAMSAMSGMSATSAMSAMWAQLA